MKNQKFIKHPLAYALSLLVMSLVANTSFAQNDDLLLQCANITDNAARLVCYDQMANGDTPEILNQKRTVDLSGTFKSTIKGNPQVVFSQEEEDANKQTDATDMAVDTSQEPTLQKQVVQQPIVESKTINDTQSKVLFDNDKSAAQSEVKPSLKDRFKGLFNKDDQYKDNVEISTQGDVLTEIGVSKDALDKYTPLSLAFDLDKNSERGLWSARPHNANYILPYYYNTKPNYDPTSPSLGTQSFSDDELRKIELKFQLSLKTKAAQNLFGTDADLWIGYTQQSHWQTYNEDNSRPFRAHDYQPEIFLTQPVKADLPLNGKLRMLGVGAIHHSNGESDPLSRSWNRLYVMGGAEWGKLTVVPSVWIALKNKEGSKESDNPDITDYYGYGDVKFLYRLSDGKNISGTARFNPKTGKGGVQLDYVHPIGRGVSGYAQIFQGYGQSLIDYNHEATSVGFGIMLNDWLGL